MTTIEVLDFMTDLAGSIGGRLIIKRGLGSDIHLRLDKQAIFDYGEEMLRMFKRRVEHEFKAEIHAISGNPEATIP